MEAPEPIGTLVRPEIPDLPGSKVGSDESESLSTGGRGQTAFPSWFQVLWGKKKKQQKTWIPLPSVRLDGLLEEVRPLQGSQGVGKVTRVGKAKPSAGQLRTL